MGAAASDYFTPYADVQYGFLDDELGILNLHDLAAKGAYHRVSAYLKKGLDPNRPSFDDDDDYAREDTPMICAARGNLVRRGRKRHLKTLDVLFRFGGDVNKWNYLEQTPLYIACEKNLTNVAQWLVLHGSDVNKSSKVGVSPLLCAYRNGNAVIVQLLLDHGAKAIDPPRDFGRVQFPTIAKELRGENTDVCADDSDDDASSESSLDDNDAAQRPVSSYLRLRPPWKKSTAPIEVSETLPTVRPTTAAPGAIRDMDRMREDIATTQQRQQQQRDAILKDIDEKRRIDEQREYREKLAVDNAKRKAQRQLRRDKANYDKYIAHVEDRRRQQAQPSQSNARERPSTVVGIQWNKQQENSVRQIHTAPSRVGRSTWTALEVSTTHVAGSKAHHGDETLLRESRAVFDALQAQQTHRDRLRQVYTAPALPPLGKRPAKRPETVA